jgi:hypothetical protein
MRSMEYITITDTPNPTYKVIEGICTSFDGYHVWIKTATCNTGDNILVPWYIGANHIADLNKEYAGKRVSVTGKFTYDYNAKKWGYQYSDFREVRN